MRRPFSCLSFFRGNIALQMVKDRHILHVRVGLRWPQAAAPPETTGLDVWRLIVILALIECFQTKLWAALAPQAWYYGQLVARTSNTGLRKNTRHWRMSSEREPHAFLCQNLQLKWGEKKNACSTCCSDAKSEVSVVRVPDSCLQVRVDLAPA